MTRLLDMGVEPYLVASSIEGVLAQRLIRKLCVHCRREITPSDADLPQEQRGVPGTYYEPVGCRECRDTGYRGRVGIFELFTVTDGIREMIMKHENAARIAEAGLAEGALLPLSIDGFDKARQGRTSIMEVRSAAQG